MASEFAETINTAYFQNTEGALLRNVIDAEREVLFATSRHRTANGPCWCVVVMHTLPHTEDCQRARALMEKLEV